MDLDALEQASQQMEADLKQVDSEEATEEVIEEAVSEESPNEEINAEEDVPAEQAAESSEEEISPAKRRYMESRKVREAEERARQAELELARLQGMQEASQEQKKEDVDPEPNAELDPEGHLQWQNRQLSKKVDDINNRYEELKQDQERTEGERAWDQADRNLSQTDPMYAKSMKFLRDAVTKYYQEENPLDTPADIAARVRQEELKMVRDLARANSNIPAYVKGMALQLGMKLETAPAKPQTDKREVKHHKEKSGSIASVPTGGGKGKLSAGELAEMSTMQDLFTLGNTSDSDWRRMASEAAQG